MGKKIKNPIELRAVVHIDKENSVPFHIEYAVVKYDLTCEHEVCQRKGLPLFELTPQDEKIFTQEMKNCLKDFTEEAIRQVDIDEEITEEESLIQYPIV